jgi:transcriptional regulator with XRE-family HTH domain
MIPRLGSNMTNVERRKLIAKLKGGITLDGGARIDGRRVKELRRALLLSQRELAQLAGVVTETVNRIERQPERTFRPDTVRHLAKVLGVDPHELMVVEEPEDVDAHELMVEEPEDAAKNLAQLATVGREDGYTHFSRQEGIPTTGNEGEIYRLSYRIGELERRRDQGDFTEDEKNELAKLSLRRQVLLGQALLGEM